MVSPALRWGWVCVAVRVVSYALELPLLWATEAGSGPALLERTQAFPLIAALALTSTAAGFALAALGLFAWFDSRSLRVPAAMIVLPPLVGAVVSYVVFSDRPHSTEDDTRQVFKIVGALSLVASCAGQVWLADAWGRHSGQRVDRRLVLTAWALAALDSAAVLASFASGFPHWVRNVCVLAFGASSAALWFSVRAVPEQQGAPTALPWVAGALGHLARGLKASLALVAVAVLTGLGLAARSEFFTLVGLGGLAATLLYATGSQVVGLVGLLRAAPQGRTASAAAATLLLQAAMLGVMQDQLVRGLPSMSGSAFSRWSEGALVARALSAVAVALFLVTLKRLREEWLASAEPAARVTPLLVVLLLGTLLVGPLLVDTVVGAGPLSVVLGVASVVAVVLLLGTVSALRRQAGDPGAEGAA